MENRDLQTALRNFYEKLKSYGKNPGAYQGYVSTSKGISMHIASKTIFIYHSVIHKLLYNPEDISEEDINSCLR